MNGVTRVEEPAPLSGLDGLWLTLDRTTEFDPVILSTWTFADKVPLADLRASLGESADQFVRFKSRLEVPESFELPRFVKDPRFDIDKHVTAHDLPEPAGPREFDAFCSEFTSRHWDLSRSPWEAVLCPNYRDPDTGARSACVLRAYHALADGQGLVRASLWGSDYRSEVEKFTLKPTPSKPEAPPSSYYELVRSWTATSMWTIYSVLVLFGMTSATAIHKTHLTPSNLGARFDPKTPWAEKPSRSRTFNDDEQGPRKRVFARSRAIKVSDIKIVQKAFTGGGQAFQDGQEKWTTRLAGTHVTLNDVIVSILAEIFHARRDLIKAQQSSFEHAIDAIIPDRVCFLIPISIRADSDPTAKNVVAMAMVFLPKTGVAEDPARRTARDIYESIHRQKFELNVIKKSRTPSRIARRWLDPLAHIPYLWPWPFAHVPGASLSKYITTPIMNAIFAVPHAITTNVPGPSVKVKIGGQHEIVDWNIAPPQGTTGTLGIGIMSYNGKLTISALADHVKDGRSSIASEICEDFERVFDIYLRVAKEVLKEE